MAFKKLVQCPACRFTNRAGDARCLVCKAELPADAPEAPPPATPPGVQQRFINAGGTDSSPRVAPGRPVGPPRAQQRPPAGPARPPVKGPPPPAQKKPAAPVANQTSPMRRPPPSDLVSTDEALATDEARVDGASDDEGTSALAREGKATPTTRIVSANIDRSKIVGWLVCDPLPPIPLGGKPLLTIGRHHECDLVLPHKEISRRHAVVKVRGANIVFEDEGSSNGSYVNGQRVSHSLLRVGDTIAIGPYEVEVRSNDDMSSSSDDKSDTRTNLELTSVSRLNPLAAMTGKIQEVPLAEVLQGIEFNKKTGTLTVVSERQQGALVVSGGAPVFARWGDLTDDKAVLRMLTLIKGRFAFAGEVQPGERTMRSSLTGLLLEASRLIDEGETAPSDKGGDSAASAVEGLEEDGAADATS